MPKVGFSKIKLEENLLKEINSILRSGGVSDTRVQFVSITRVELNNDYSMAKVYWDTFDASKRGDSKKAIEGMTGKIRKSLSQSLNARHTPSLDFIYDSQFEDELKIAALLKDNEPQN